MSQSSASSPPNNSKRKQPTIASFFTKKPSSSSQKAPSGPDTYPERNTQDQEEDEEKKSESEEKNGIPIPEGGGEDDDEGDIIVPVPKRARKNRSQSQDPERERESSLDENPQSQPPSQQTDLSKFTSSPAVPAEGVHNAKCQERNERTKEKEKLHQQFVKRLGGPDCLIGIGSRNTASEAVADEADADDDEELSRPPPAKGKATTKKGGSKLTPLEKQVIDIKRKHMDTVLVVEVGYKFRFFGEDARTAAKELSIVCIPGKFRYDERMYFASVTGDHANLVCCLSTRPLRSPHRPFRIREYPRPQTPCPREASDNCRP